MTDLFAQFQHYATCQMARVLTQMDRDPNSPTFGCFDRQYWHYKIRDFPSSILQQGLFTLEAVRTGWLAPGVKLDRVEQWCVGAIQALGRQVNGKGAVDEYYPFEQSYPAAAFGLYAVGRVLYDWQTQAPQLYEQIDLQPLSRLTRHLAARVEQEAMNQQAAGLAGLALASQLKPLAAAVDDLKAHADRLFSAQHPEGWFNEYGGPDFGYLAVTLDALADYYDATRDPRALDATDRAIAFLAQLVGADGRLPSTLNCRNTDYVVPYGLVRAAARNPLASWLVHTLFEGMDQPNHFLWATDDRYHCHYVYASVVRSLPYLQGMLPPQAPSIESSLWLEGCGYWIYWSPDRQWTAYVAARKGGLVRIHQQGRGAIADHGWRIQTSKTLFTSNWWSANWQIQRQGESLQIQGACQASQFHVPTPPKHAVLRLLSSLFGAKLIPLLKQAMIFRTGKAVGPTFSRTIQIHPDRVSIQDRIERCEGAIATPSPRQNLRHVASADSFSAEEWVPSLMPPGQYALTADLSLQTDWKPEDSDLP